MLSVVATAYVRRRGLVFAGMALLASGLGACGGDSPTPPPAAPPTGTLRVNVAGLPDGGSGMVEIEGPGARFVVARDTVLTRVPPGTYRVTPQPVLIDGQSYADTTSRPPVVVVAEQFAVTQVEYRFRPTTVRVVIAGLTESATLVLPFVDSLGRTQNVTASNPMANGRVTAVRAGTYQVTVPRWDGRLAVFAPDTVRRTVVVPAASEVVLTVAYRQISGTLTVAFADVPNLPVSTTVLDSAGVVLGRLTPVAPTLFKVIEGPVRLVPDTVVLANGFQVQPARAADTVQIERGQAVARTLRYVGRPQAGFNVRLTALDVVQAAHSLAGPLPLVAGREALARVTVLANGANVGLRPEVEIEVAQANGGRRTLRAPALRPFVPITPQMDTLLATWNVVVPAELVQPGMAVRARLLPDTALMQDPAADNVVPAVGEIALDVRPVRPLTLVFFPVEIDGFAYVPTANQVTTWIEAARAMLPIGEISARVMPPTNFRARTHFAVVDSLRRRRERLPFDTSEVWIGLLDGISGGAAFLRQVASVGVAPLSMVPIGLAHELGHIFGVGHAPGCGAANIDPRLPFADGRVASWGWDVQRGQVVPRGTFDLMGYCAPVWTSDFAWRTILEGRTRSGSGVP